MSTLLHTTDADFERDVLKSDKPVLVDFGADWCGPCQALKPALEQLSAERSDIKIITIDIETDRALFDRLGLSGIPQMVLIKDGQYLGRFNGLIRTKSNISSWIDSTLADAQPKTAEEFIAGEAAAKTESDKNYKETKEWFLKKFAYAALPWRVAEIGAGAALALTSPVQTATMAGALFAGFTTAKLLKDWEKIQATKEMSLEEIEEEADLVIEKASQRPSLRETFKSAVAGGIMLAGGLMLWKAAPAILPLTILFTVIGGPAIIKGGVGIIGTVWRYTRNRPGDPPAPSAPTLS